MSDQQMTPEEFNRARPSDFDVFEEIVDTSRTYAAFLVGGKQERIPEGATWPSGKANLNAGKRVCTANFRLAHDPALPVALAACQGRLVRFEAANSDKRYGEFCSGLGVDKFTFDPAEYGAEGRELACRVRLKKREYNRKETNPETGQVIEVPTIQVEVVQAFRA